MRSAQRHHDPSAPASSTRGFLRSAVRGLRLLRARLYLGRRFSHGHTTLLGPNITWRSPRFARLGDNVSIGRDVMIETDLTIEANVLVSSRVAFISDDHRFDDPASNVFEQGRREPVETVLEGDNLIGHGSIVIGPVRIGYGAIVGAGSLVTRDIPPNTIAVGRPATVLRQRPGREGQPRSADSD